MAEEKKLNSQLEERNAFLSPEVVDIIRKIAIDATQAFTLQSGVNNTARDEITTNYEQTSAEKVIRGKNNSMIILGNDRFAGVGSGKGGVGQTGASAIDIVAGHMGLRPIDKVNGQAYFSSKNFEIDSARIYLTQRGNIDSYFNLPKVKVKLEGFEGYELENTDNRSAFAAKADCIRLIGRENVKIVTQHLAQLSSGEDPMLNGIDIIAGYDNPDPSNELQPMVKGNNLLELLKNIISTIQEVQSSMSNFIDLQTKLNNTFASHKHALNTGKAISDKPMEENSPLISTELFSKIIPDIINNNMKFQLLIKEYFDASSPKYVNSIYNKVN
jgi:hypothetical protein